MPVGLEAVTLWYGVLVFAVVCSLFGLWVLGFRPDHIRRQLTSRFLYGIPWGSLVCLVGVFAVYLVVQRGLWDWHRPVVVRYMAFSVFEPVGWAFAGFAHAGPGHLLGNVTSAIVFAPLVEYIWSHYPPDRRRSWEPSWLRRPRIRAFVIFPLGIILLGALSGLFSWGPVIGFSFVIFALIGCALVHYPVITLAALFARGGVRVLRDTMTDPVTVAETTVRVARPGWYGTAVQGHLFGLLVGVLVGIWLARYWRRPPSRGRLWVASVFVGLGLSIWALWWMLGPEQFIVFRALGVGLVFLIATAIVWAAHTSAEPVLPRIDHSPARVGLGIIIVAVVAMGMIGFALNLAVIEPTSDHGGVSTGGYDVFYAEDVPDGMVPLGDIEVFGLSTNVTTSGVIVQSPERNIWYRSISPVELKTHGQGRVRIGDLTWSQSVSAARTGWSPADNRTVYAIWLNAGDVWEPVWDSDPARAGPVVDGHQVTIHVDDGTFSLEVERNRTTDHVSIPAHNESIDVLDIEIIRTNDDLMIHSNETVVRIASLERYA